MSLTVDTRYLAVPTCYETHPVNTIVLNFEDPLISYAPAIRGHKTLMHFLPYLLLAHVSKFFANIFLPFSARMLVGMNLDFVE